MRRHNFLAVLLCLVAAEVQAESGQLSKCRTLEAEFDYKGMVAECSIAAADPNTSKAARIEASRLLAFAHTALGDDDTAQVWFLRLLVIDPEHQLPSEVSPRFRDAFARAQGTFEKRGAVGVVHSPPSADVSVQGGPLMLAFDVTDQLGRVARAVLEVEVIVGEERWPVVQTSLSRMPTDQPGLSRFQGELPDPAAARGSPPERYVLSYRLVLENAVGDPVIPSTPLATVALPRRGPEATGPGPLVWSGAAAAGGVLVVGAIGGAFAVYCATGNCSSRAVPPPIGFVSVSVEGAEGARP